MKAKIILLIVFITPLTYCQSNSQKRDDKCKENVENALRCMNEYDFTDNGILLDSALYYLNNIDEKCKDYQAIIPIHKASVYFLKKDFSKAIELIGSCDDNIFPFPEYKSILIDKILAKTAINQGNIEESKVCYGNIVKNFNVFVEKNKSTLDSLFVLDSHNDIGFDPYVSVFIEMYYYKTKEKNIDMVIQELDSIQKAVNGNVIFFDELKKKLSNEDLTHSFSFAFD